MTVYTGPLEWVAVDFDGTLSGLAWTPAEPTKMGDPLWHNVWQLKDLKDLGWKVAIHTARDYTQTAAIMRWLDRWNLTQYVDKIVTDKFLAHRYIDDRALKAQDKNWVEQL